LKIILQIICRINFTSFAFRVMYVHAKRNMVHRKMRKEKTHAKGKKEIRRIKIKH